jgi:hypothetical protein
MQRNISLISIAVVFLVSGIFASIGPNTAKELLESDSSLKAQVISPPTSLPSPTAQFLLQPGEERPFVRSGGSMFELEARIDSREATGAAYLLEVSVDRGPLGLLVNKANTFSDEGRLVPYCAPSGAWAVFFSPNFSANNEKASPNHSIREMRYDYRYKWKLPGAPTDEVTVKIRHAAVYEGRVIHRPLVIRI